MESKANIPILSFASQADWEDWLEEQPADSKGVWLKIAKKNSGVVSVDYTQALESALCHGWIDGQKAAYDDAWWLQKFTPRKARSEWSKVNREKAEALIAAGRMRPAGLRQVELARADGRWEKAYDSQSKIGVPPDFQSELEKNPAALDFFNTLNNVNRYAILHRVQTAAKTETRAARIHKFIDMLARKETIYP